MILFSELLPNPAGDDRAGEFFELANDGSVVVSLVGWSVRDKAGKEYIFGDVSVPAHGFFVVSYAQSKLSLNNDSETLVLTDPSGAVVDSVSYEGGVAEGVALARGDNETLLPSMTVTAGSPNAITEPDYAAPQPFWDIQEHGSVLYEGSLPVTKEGVVVFSTAGWEVIVWGVVVAGFCVWLVLRVNGGEKRP